MIDNKNKQQKSNKHSDHDTKELIERPTHYFDLVEPDEVLKGTVEGYRKVATKWFTNFNGALFSRSVDNLLKANTDLTKDQLLEQLNRKLGVNLVCLNALLTNTSLPYPNVYKNLDDFKSVHTFKIDNISVTFEDWSKVYLIRYDTDIYHPIHYINYDISKWEFNDFVIRNVVNYDISYSNYLSNVTYPYASIVATRSINKTNNDTYNNAFNKFKVRKDVVYNNISDLDVTVTFTFDVDLYFSHIKYLYKVFNTYSWV